MSDKIIYDQDLMDQISAKYKEGFNIVEELIENFNLFKESFIEYYDGQSNDEIFATLSETLSKHLEILKLCYSNMSEYVFISKKLMMALDDTFSDVFDKWSEENGD